MAAAPDPSQHPDVGERPRFTVVVPAVNEERYLPACLASLAAQDFDGEVEVVVVDNGSTDRTAEVARRLGARVVQEPRPGVCFARQAGTEQARGQIVVSTDADTTFDRGWLTRIDRRFRARPDRVAVAGPCRFVAGPWWGAVYTTVVFGAVVLLHRLTGRVFYASATNIAFRRDAWTGYDTHLTQGGDELGLLRNLRRAGRLDFDNGNPTFTSSRRLQRGLAYNLLVTCLFYYLIGYGLNRLAGRRVLGTAPEFREADPVRVRKGRPRWQVAASSVAAVLAILLVTRLGWDLA
ncbi:MAG: glycosyltransferase family 2 protein [Nocardioidaceae bacterium]